MRFQEFQQCHIWWHREYDTLPEWCLEREQELSRLLDEISGTNKKREYEHLGYCAKGIISLREISKDMASIYGGVIACNSVAMLVSF